MRSPVTQDADEWVERCLDRRVNDYSGFGALGSFVLAEVLAAKPLTGKPGWEDVQATWREAMHLQHGGGEADPVMTMAHRINRAVTTRGRARKWIADLLS